MSTDYLLGTDENTPELQEIKKESPQKFEAILKIYNAMLKEGLIQPDEALTDKKVDLLIDVIVANKSFIDKLCKEDG